MFNQKISIALFEPHLMLLAEILPPISYHPFAVVMIRIHLARKTAPCHHVERVDLKQGPESTNRTRIRRIKMEKVCQYLSHFYFKITKQIFKAQLKYARIVVAPVSHGREDADLISISHEIIGELEIEEQSSLKVDCIKSFSVI